MIEPLHIVATSEATASSEPMVERERLTSSVAKKPLARCDAEGESREEAANELLLSLALEAEEEDEDLESRKEQDEIPKRER